MTKSKLHFSKEDCLKLFIENVTLDEHVAQVSFHAFEIFQNPGVGELVQVDEQKSSYFLSI